ncbi:MAG: hypothetical protein JO307_16940 [Bryobacterales bacterium]|nr:hypothetical protein [Bryobacterales bacterium]MBV9401315.1 hypothetical protein [Bryobacterales bacterium]
MTSVVQARLDADEQKILDNLVHQLGWSPSKIVREGIRLVAACHPPRKRPRIIGTGEFSSGIGDLSFNKKHLEDFGRD